MDSFLEVALSPLAVNKFIHTVTSSWIIGALFTVAVGCYYLYCKREQRLALASIKIGGVVGLVACLLALHSGDNSAYRVAQVQPMKLAAMEALYQGGHDQALTAVAWVNPFEQPDYANTQEPPLRVALPYALSFLATRDIHGFVPGVNDLLKGGYPRPDGTIEPSVEEKIQRGRQAIGDLKLYREMRASLKGAAPDAAMAEELESLTQSLQANMPYFGYGYVKDPAQLVPYIPVCFYAFRAMVGLGTLFILFFAVVLLVAYRSDLTRYRWLLVSAIVMLPLGYIASESGWLVAEFGRQPWAIQDMLPTWVGVSDVKTGSVMLTFFLFLLLFSTLLVVEVSILWRAIRRGPTYEEEA